MNSDNVITSASNPKVKYINSLLKKSGKRASEKAYVVEGLRIVLDAPIEDVRCIIVTLELLESEPKASQFVQRCTNNGTEVIHVSSKLMKEISDTVTPQGIMAIISRKNYELLLEKSRFLLLEDVRDPGNMGTLFRTAEAAGIDEVILSRDCVDIYNPKTIRSTMGTIYRLPHVICDSNEQWQDVIGKLKSSGVTLYGGALKEARQYDKVDYHGKCGIVIGNEANGISSDTLSLIEKIYIPMEGQIESLNAAVAGSILMYAMKIA